MYGNCDKARIVHDNGSPIPQFRHEIRFQVSVCAAISSSNGQDPDRFLLRYCDQRVIALEKISDIGGDLLIGTDKRVGRRVRFDNS